MANVKDFINENLEDEKLDEAKITKDEVVAYGNKAINTIGPKIAKMEDVGKRVKGLDNASDLAGWYHQMLASKKELQKTITKANKVKEDNKTELKNVFKEMKKAEKKATKYVDQIHSVEAKIISGRKNKEQNDRVKEQNDRAKEKRDAFRKKVKSKIAFSKTNIKKAKFGKDANPAKNFMAQFKKS